MELVAPVSIHTSPTAQKIPVKRLTDTDQVSVQRNILYEGGAGELGHMGQ